MLIDDLIEEMKAKVTANCGMTMTVEETKEILAALTSPEAVAESAPGVEAKKETLPPELPAVEPDAEPVIEDDPPAEDIPEKKGALPDDFPGRNALAGAGINTFTQARKARDSKEGLTGIAGVGDATARSIEEAL